MSVTFKEVAELAGVSTQTVSRVTNGATNVAEATRKKVNAAIEQLGYVPNRGAQLLRCATPRIIGLITLDIALHGVSLIANGIRQQAQKQGYGISFSVVTEHAYDKIAAAVRELKSQQIELIAVNVPLTSEEAQSLVAQHADLKFAFIDVPPDACVNSVCGDHYQGAVQAAQLMLSLQRTRLLLITGPADSSASQLRLRGWLDQIAQQGASVVGQYEGDWHARSGYMLAREALSSQQVFDGVLVASDQMALGVLCALREFNLEVPRQVSVIGFDGIEDGAFFSPPLTTVRQDFLTIGERAVSLLLQATGEKAGELKQESIATQLIERKSTQPLQTEAYDRQAIEGMLTRISELLP